MSQRINIKEQFSDRLVYRDSFQGIYKYSAKNFRELFLKELETVKWWGDDSKLIELNFKDVETISPSWANEVFAFYTENYDPDKVKKKIKLVNISSVKRLIINLEIDLGYSNYILGEVRE